MVNLQETEEITTTKKKELRMYGVELTAGQTLQDITELITLANKTVPAGKIARISLLVRVDSIIDAEVE